MQCAPLLQVAEYIETKLGCCYETFAQQPAIGYDFHTDIDNALSNEYDGKAI